MKRGVLPLDSAVLAREFKLVSIVNVSLELIGTK
jgi:hypothetical protein